jgi:hypothetical protein
VSPRDELKCYGLPYGALGFVSHLLTLYSSLCLIHRRKAYFPLSKIKPGNHTLFDVVVSFITFVVTVTLTSVTMARCKNSWQYILLAVQSLFLSVALSAISLSSSLKSSDESHYTVSTSASRFAFAGIAAGSVGYVTLLVQNWSNKNVKIALGAVLGGSGLLISVGAFVILEGLGSWRLKSVDLLTILVAFYLFSVSMTDWVLGAIAGDVSGIPEGKVAILVWLYFAVRRLPIFIS